MRNMKKSEKLKETEKEKFGQNGRTFGKLRHRQDGQTNGEEKIMEKKERLQEVAYFDQFPEVCIEGERWGGEISESSKRGVGNWLHEKGARIFLKSDSKTGAKIRPVTSKGLKSKKKVELL